MIFKHSCLHCIVNNEGKMVIWKVLKMYRTTKIRSVEYRKFFKLSVIPCYSYEAKTEPDKYY